MPIIKTIKNAVKHWYLPLLIGLIFLITGVYTFISPAAAYLTLAMLFSLSFLFSGFSDIIFALANRKELDNWGWTLGMGIITVLVGIILYVHPEISMATLPFVMGFLLMFRSMSAIGISIDMKSYEVESWGFLLALGVLGMLFSFFLIWNPIAAGITLVAWTGLALLVIGIFHIILAFKLKKLKSKLNL